VVPHNATANLRANQIKGERSELPTIARQVQRTLYDMVVMLASTKRGTEANKEGAKDWADGTAESVNSDCGGGEKSRASAKRGIADAFVTDPSEPARNECTRNSTEETAEYTPAHESARTDCMAHDRAE
jgi:hypothetical protein